MRVMLRALGVLACLVGFAQLAWLNAQTGGHAWTSFPDPALAAMKAHEGEAADLMGGSASTPIDNDFHFGWLPAGTGREILSVTTLAVPMMVALAAIALSARRRVSDEGV